MRIIVSNASRGESLNHYLSGHSIGADVITAQREVLRESVNMDGALCEILRIRGHEVVLFDAYEDDLVTPMPTAARAANRLCVILDRFRPDEILFDLQYFGEIGVLKAVL